MNTYRRMLRYLRPHVWPYGILAVIFMLAFSGIESSIPFLIKFTFDQVFTKQRAEMLHLAVVAALGLSFVRGGVGFVADYLNDWIGQRVVTDMRNELTAHMQDLDVAFFNRQRAGQIVSRVMADVTLVRSCVTDAVRSLFQDTTTLIGLVSVAFYMDWVLALMAVVLFPVAGLPLRFFSNALRQNSRRQQEATARMTAMLHENVQGNRIVKLFGQERYESGRFRDHDERIFRLFMRSSRMRSLPIAELLAGIVIAGIIYYGGASVIAGTRTPGSFFAFMATAAFLFEPFKKLVRTNYTIQQGIAGAERVFALLDTPAHVVDRPKAIELPGIQQGIEFDDVWFEYEEGRPVLRGIDLRIPAGKVVALVGMSGGGKSTLADLIPRLYDVTRGSITIDGVDVRDLTLRSLRARIAVVAQFTFLFNDTVRSNIAFGEPDRPQADVVAAARAANAHDFVMAMPRGYDTFIGERGQRLSGGQRQRLAIARALLKNAPILVLDEATSALDAESELLVQEALSNLMLNRTSFVIAHRLSTIRRADAIIVLEEGRIAKIGRHDDLVGRPSGTYAALYQMQLLEGRKAERRMVPS